MSWPCSPCSTVGAGELIAAEPRALAQHRPGPLSVPTTKEGMAYEEGSYG